jgi:hypothetical protein
MPPKLLILRITSNIASVELSRKYSHPLYSNTNNTIGYRVFVFGEPWMNIDIMSRKGRSLVYNKNRELQVN